MRTAKEYVPGSDLSDHVAFFTISVRKHVSDASDQWNLMIFTTFLLARDTKCSDHLKFYITSAIKACIILDLFSGICV